MKGEIARSLFENGFMCSQAVFATFAPELGLDEKTALKIGTCFNSGMRKGEVCGACTGALMALGLKFGQDDIKDTQSRLKSNEVAVRFLDEFKKENGDYICNKLLGCDITTKEGVEYALENKLFFEFCPKMVESAANIAQRIIEDNQ